MNATYSFNLRRRAARLATILTIFAFATLAASAQAPPYALFQDSTLSSTTNTINVTQLPVVLTTGTVYYNLVVSFDVSATGGLTVVSIQQTAAPQTKDDGFEAGNYAETTTGSPYVTVSGPGVASNGSTVWTLSEYNQLYCSNPNMATWYDVGSNIKNSPIYSRLKAAGITSTEFYQYGVNGSNGCDTSDAWLSGGLLGFSQAGGTLAIASFSDNGKDQSTPVTTTTYFLTTQQ